MTTQLSTTQSAPPKTRRDVRTFWRVGLGIIAPLPLLAEGISYLLHPADGDASLATTVAATQAHHTLMTLAVAFSVFFLLLLIPATAATAWLTRRRAPVLTTVGAVWALLGFLAAFPTLPGGDQLAVVVADNNFDVATMARLDDALWAQPLPNVTVLLFLSGIVIALPLLGIALWRTGAVPRWQAACLIVGTVTHPFLPNHTIQGIGLLVGAAGFLGVGRALLRMRNDEFDLPAL